MVEEEEGPADAGTRRAVAAPLPPSPHPLITLLEVWSPPNEAREEVGVPCDSPFEATPSPPDTEEE